MQLTDPVRYKRFMELENQMQARLQSSLKIMPSGTIIVPIVVHVVYNTTAQNISDAQIVAQMQVLNNDFKRLNPDAVNTPTAFQSGAGRLVQSSFISPEIFEL